jgi:hypothetical protein
MGRLPLLSVRVADPVRFEHAAVIKRSASAKNGAARVDGFIVSGPPCRKYFSCMEATLRR